MKLILIALLCAGTTLLGYVVGHCRGYSKGMRLECNSAVVFSLVARTRLDKGQSSEAKAALDNQLNVAGAGLARLEKAGPVGSIALLESVIPGRIESQIATLQEGIKAGVASQATPVPAGLLAYVDPSKAPAPGPAGTSAAAPPGESTATAPAPAPESSGSTVKGGPSMPSGMERQRH